MQESWNTPILLDNHNYTPLTRTPWAGRKVSALFKEHLFPAEVSKPVGESWEFSCDPSFPSKLLGQDMSLSSLVASNPEEFLGATAGGKGFCEILIKLLSADQPLSVQVHPSDGDVDLMPQECGKPESWLVLDADPGCGLYLGFLKPLSRDELRAAFLSGEDVSDLLNFVPVKEGDYFEISPGVPHAIGPGVCLLEPQRIVFGQSGKTYRMWDWGRKYNSDGVLDMERGQGRELHLDAALKLVDPMTQVGDEFVSSTRRIPVTKVVDSGVTVKSFPSNPYYQVHVFEFCAGGRLEFTVEGGYGAFTSLMGEVVSPEKLRIPIGQSAFFPAGCYPLNLSAENPSTASLVIPAHTRLSF